MCHCTIFGFGTGERHRLLMLGGPRHQVVTEVDAEVGGGAACAGQPAQSASE
jgi:hypothetical protein